MMDQNNKETKRIIEKSQIYNSTIGRLSSILQEEKNIKAMFDNANINYLLIDQRLDSQPILSIVNTEIKLIHQHSQCISWQITSKYLSFPLEMTFLLKVNTLENSTLLTIIFSIKSLNTTNTFSSEDNSMLLTSIFHQVNKLIDQDNYYRTQMETIVIDAPRQIIWDHIIKWEYAKKDKANCSELTFNNDPNAKGTEITFLDNNKKLLKYKVTLSTHSNDDDQWMYFLELIEDPHSIFQQVKFIITSIEANRTYISMENFFDHNVSGVMLEEMKKHKKLLLDDMKKTLECKSNTKNGQLK